MIVREHHIAGRGRRRLRVRLRSKKITAKPSTRLAAALFGRPHHLRAPANRKTKCVGLRGTADHCRECITGCFGSRHPAGSPQRAAASRSHRSPFALLPTLRILPPRKQFAVPVTAEPRGPERRLRAPSVCAVVLRRERPAPVLLAAALRRRRYVSYRRLIERLLLLRTSASTQPSSRPAEQLR